MGALWVHFGFTRTIVASLIGHIERHVRRFSQSIHLNPETKEGLEILSVLLALPPYRRAALLRTVLAEHLRRAALDQYPGVTPKTRTEIVELLARRTSRVSQRRTPVPAPRPDPVPFSSVDTPRDAPETLDLDARLDRLQF